MLTKNKKTIEYKITLKAIYWHEKQNAKIESETFKILYICKKSTSS